MIKMFQCGPVCDKASVDYELGVFAKPHRVGFWFSEIAPKLSEPILIILFQYNRLWHLYWKKLNTLNLNLWTFKVTKSNLIMINFYVIISQENLWIPESISFRQLFFWIVSWGISDLFHRKRYYFLSKPPGSILLRCILFLEDQ